MSFGPYRAIAVAALLAATSAAAQDTTRQDTTRQDTARPPIGDFGSPPNAMIFYVAHGADGACGPGCSDWIAAEGTVQWDTYKRLINILDRQNGKKLPLVIHASGRSDLKVSTGMGRVLHDRGIDTMNGATEVDACAGKSEADCFLLKRPGGPLEARLNTSGAYCDIACVLILSGGIHRSLAPGTRVILSGMEIHNRLAPNISDERRSALTIGFDNELRAYLRDMGIDTELMDIVDQNSGLRRTTEVPPADWARLHLVTTAPQ